MTEFDAEAYNAASNLFRMAQMVRKSLPSIIAQIADSVDMLGAKPLDGMPRSRTGENGVENFMVNHVELLEKLSARRDEYRRVQTDCEAVVGHDAGRCGDAVRLRARLRQGEVRDSYRPRRKARAQAGAGVALLVKSLPFLTFGSAIL